MWRCSVPLLKFANTSILFGTCDLGTLKEKLRIAKYRKGLEKSDREKVSQVTVVEGWSEGDTEEAPPLRSSDFSDEDIALRLGVGDNPYEPVDFNALQKRKAVMTEMINFQQERRRLSRDAFLEWQSSQREKGSGERLRKMTGKAERFKRFQNNQAEGRMLSVTFHSSDGDNTSNDWNPHYKSLEYSRRLLQNGSGLGIRIGSPGGKAF